MRGSGFPGLRLQRRSQFFVIGGNPEQKNARARGPVRHASSNRNCVSTAAAAEDKSQ